MVPLRLVRVSYGDPDAVRLVTRVQAEYVVRYGGPDETPIDPLMFEPPHGSFFVGYLGPDAVATGAWRRLAADHATGPGPGAGQTAEIKRMYVVPEVRGQGHARTVLAHLESSAAEAGHERLVLETGTAQPEAIALYTSSGYTPTAKFGHYRDSPMSRSFAKLLRTADAPPTVRG